jgi:O-methyltransferase
MSNSKVPFVPDVAASLFARRARTLGSHVGFVDLDDSMRSIIRTVEPYTLTSGERIAALCTSVDYVIDHGIPGAFVECGLWRGGSLMAILLRLCQRGISDRDVVGFDTFEGMTKPTGEDVDFQDRAVRSRTWVETLKKVTKLEGSLAFSRDEVFAVLASTGYAPERIHLVAGPVEDTLPAHAPDTVAVLRLDTDFYVSTRHELEHLYPRIPVGGVLIIDDYGHFKGARKAVDEYLKGHRVLLQRVDYSCRLAIKQQER